MIGSDCKYLLRYCDDNHITQDDRSNHFCISTSFRRISEWDSLGCMCPRNFPKKVQLSESQTYFYSLIPPGTLATGLKGRGLTFSNRIASKTRAQIVNGKLNLLAFL